MDLRADAPAGGTCTRTFRRVSCCSSDGGSATYRAPQRTCPHWPVSKRRARAQRLSQPASACEPHNSPRAKLHILVMAQQLTVSPKQKYAH